MDIKAALRIALFVLKDWRVIAITVAVVLYLAFYISIITYRKKPKKPAAKKKRPAPKPAEPEADNEKEDETKR